MPVRAMFLLLVLILLILAGIVFYPQLENRLLFYPDAGFDDSPSNWNLSYKDVLLRTKDGETLHCWFFPLEGKSPIVLFCHGNAGNISHRIENVEQLVRRGVIFDKTPQFNPIFNIYHTMFRDPNGYLIEIQEFIDPVWD